MARVTTAARSESSKGHGSLNLLPYFPRTLQDRAKTSAARHDVSELQKLRDLALLDLAALLLGRLLPKDFFANATNWKTKRERYW